MTDYHKCTEFLDHVEKIKKGRLLNGSFDIVERNLDLAPVWATHDNRRRKDLSQESRERAQTAATKREYMELKERKKHEFWLKKWDYYRELKRRQA